MIVLGDLNDEPLAATTQILLGPPGSEFNTGGFDQPDKGDGQRLWNLAPTLPEEPRLQPHLQRPRGADRPHPRQPRARRRGCESADTGSDRPAVGRRDPGDRATRRAPTTRRSSRASSGRSKALMSSSGRSAMLAS